MAQSVPNASPEPPDRDDQRTTFRPDIPSSARIYDYFFGDKEHTRSRLVLHFLAGADDRAASSAGC